MDEVRDLALRRAAEDHLLRRHRDPAHHRLPGLRRDRPRGRRRPGRRHRAHRRPGRRRRAPVAGRARRRHHHDHPQDPARPARRDDHEHRRARQGARQGGLPRPAGRPAQPHHRRDRGRAARRRRPPTFRDYAHAIVANAKALADGARPRAASTSSPAAPTTTCCWSTSPTRRIAGQAGRQGARPGRHRAQLQHACRSTRASRSTRPASGSAPPPSPPAAWARPTWTASPAGSTPSSTAEAAGDEAAVEKVGAEVHEFTRGFPMPGLPTDPPADPRASVPRRHLIRENRPHGDLAGHGVPARRDLRRGRHQLRAVLGGRRPGRAVPVRRATGRPRRGSTCPRRDALRLARLPARASGPASATASGCTARTTRRAGLRCNPPSCCSTRTPRRSRARSTGTSRCSPTGSPTPNRVNDARLRPAHAASRS